MSRTRPLGGLVALLLTAVGLVAGALAPAPALAAGEETSIVGVVRDRSGHYLDDVLVEALSGGVVEASALTYASEQEAGPQHGFFRLHVEPGRYRLRFSKAGYLTRVYGARIRVTEGQVVEFPTVALRIRPKASRVAGRPEDARIEPVERGKVLVTVTTAATKRPTGQVTVRAGRRVVGTAKLRPARQGKATVRLVRLERGTYPLKVYYSGSEAVAAAKSRAFKLTVSKPKPHSTHVLRPNVW
jgi:hypothetical protein